MTLLTLFSAALASDPISAITEQLHGGEGPQVVLACAPLDDVLGHLNHADILTGLRRSLPEDQRNLLSLTDPGAAAAAGLDLSGPLVLAGDKAGGVVIGLPFAGGSDEAEALRQHFEAVLEDMPLQYDLEGGYFQVQMGQPTMVPVDTALLDGLPPVPGCALLATAAQPDRTDKGALVFAPFGGLDESIRMRVSTPDGLTLPPLDTPLELPDIHTDMPPIAVAVVRFEPIALLQQEQLWRELSDELSFSREEVDALAEKIRIMPGTTIAFFGNPQQPLWTATLPVANPKGRALSTWKLRRGLKKAEPNLDWSSRTTFTDASEKGPLFGEIRPGQLLLSSSDPLLAETRTDSGAPWITPEHAEHLADWPLSMHVQSPALIPGMEGRALSAYLGVQPQEDFMEVSLLLPASSREMLLELLRLKMGAAAGGDSPQLTPL